MTRDFAIKQLQSAFGPQVTEDLLAALTPPAVELSEQAGGKDEINELLGLAAELKAATEAYAPVRNKVGGQPEWERMHSAEIRFDRFCREYRMRLAEIFTAATAELQAKVNSWEGTARQHCQNESFYRDIVYSIGELFGDAAKTSDDGSLQDSVLALKVFPLARTTFALASDLGRSEGKLLASEMVGVVDRLKSRAESLQSQLAEAKEELGNHQIDRGGVLEAIGLPADAEVALAQAVREWVAAQARTTVENVEGGAQ